MKPTSAIYKKIFLFLFIPLFIGCASGKKTYVKDISEFDFQEGDILLQHIPSYLCSVIADVTNSQYSHCGIVAYYRDQLSVLEAIGPVKYTPIKKWLNRGSYGRFTQLRPKITNSAMKANAIIEARKHLGKPYDIQYKMDDANIYCSELVYKAFLKGCKIKIGEIEILGSLNWKPHEKFIRYITGGSLPLKRKMVTPESLTRGPNVSLIYSTFAPQDDLVNQDITFLAGKWQGEYTIKGLHKAIAYLHLKTRPSKTTVPDVIMKSGYLKMVNGSAIQIKSLSVSNIPKRNKLKVILTDVRGIKATLYAQIRDNGERLIGTWKDSLGYKGVFSLEKIPD